MKTVTLIFRDAKRQEAGLVGLNGLIPAGSTFFDDDSKTGHESKKRRILSKRKLMKRIAAFPSDRESRVHCIQTQGAWNHLLKLSMVLVDCLDLLF